MSEWHDKQPEDMSDALDNVRWALEQMQAALNEGRYSHGEVHVRADLSYLLAETRRARMQRLANVSALADRVEAAEAKVRRVEALADEWDRRCAANWESVKRGGIPQTWLYADDLRAALSDEERP